MRGPDGPIGGNPFRHIDPSVRWLVEEFEERQDFEGALDHLRWLSYRLDALGESIGETDRGKGNLRNVGMTLRGRASFADRSHWQACMYEIRDATGVWVPWRQLRELGLEAAYTAAKEGQGHADPANEEFWT